MTAVILLILGIRLALLGPAIDHVLVAATRWRAHRERCAEALARLGRCAPWLRCIRCFRSNSEFDDLRVCP